MPLGVGCPTPWPMPSTANSSQAICQPITTVRVLAVDLATGQILTGCVREQTAQCLSHIKAIVESIGHVMDDNVKVNIQLANIADLAEVDAIYTKYFPVYLPTRTVIAVRELPAGARIQMDAVMSNAESTPPQA